MGLLRKCRVNYFLVLSMRQSAAVRTLSSSSDVLGTLADFSSCSIRDFKKSSGSECLKLEHSSISIAIF